MNALVAPPNAEYIESDIINLHQRTRFTDVIWVGGNTNIETSTPYFDTVQRYPSFDDATDQTNVFASDDVQWNGWIERSSISNYHIDLTLPHAGILRGGDVYGSIVVDGGPYVDVYAKLDEYGFVPVRLQPVYETPEDKKYFRFDSVLVSIVNTDGLNVVYDSDVPADEPYFDSEFVSIQTYDFTYNLSPVKWQDLTLDDILVNGTEIYFRKDSSFHNWLKEFAENLYETQYEIDFVVRNYVNTDKRFLYFGEIFPTEGGKYHIVFNGLKDWVQSALPENNRTDNLVEFLDTYFDQVYIEGYQLLRDVWSLRDGRECDQKFLGYIPTFHGMPKEDVIPEWYLENYREYAAELVWLMKRKGTYAAMKIIYEILCGNSDNILTISERWSGETTTTTETVVEIGFDGELYHPDVVEGNDGFGESVAVSELYTMVGAPYDDTADMNSGLAYIYENSTGNLLHTLDNPNDYNTSYGDEFGYSLDISDTYAVVGAWNEDGSDGSSEGKVYVFDPATGSLLYTIDDPNSFDDADGDYFGTSVSISDSHIIVGAYRESTPTRWYVGSAYIFDVTDGSLLFTLDNPSISGYEYDEYGWSVGIAGSYAIVGSPSETAGGASTSGAAYIFDPTTGGLLHTLSNPNGYNTPNYDEFGWSVDISDTYSIVGAPYEDDAGGSQAGKAYIFNNLTGDLVWTLDNPNENGTYGDNFGWSVGITDTYAIVGAPSSYNGDPDLDNEGRAYVFDVLTGELVYTAEDTTPYTNGDSSTFGTSVGISNTRFVGSKVV